MPHTAMATALTRSLAETPAIKMVIRSAMPSGALEAVLSDINDVFFTEEPDGEMVEHCMDSLIICGVPESAIDPERDVTVWDDTEERDQLAIRVESSEDEKPYRDALEAAGWEIVETTAGGYIVRQEFKVAA